MQIQKGNNYLQAVQQIKMAILRSRYEAAALDNTELLKLCFAMLYISLNLLILLY